MPAATAGPRWPCSTRIHCNKRLPACCGTTLSRHGEAKEPVGDASLGRLLAAGTRLLWTRYGGVPRARAALARSASICANKRGNSTSLVW